MIDDSLMDYYLYLKRQGLEDTTVRSLYGLTEILLKECTPWTQGNFTKFLTEKSNKLSGSALNKYCQAAKKYCDFKKIRFHKSSFKRFRETPRERPTFSDDEINRFLSVPPPDNDRGKHAKMTMFWTIVAWTGARPGEVRKLDVNCVDFATGSFLFPLTKTGRGRPVIMHPLIRPQVKEYIEGLQTKYLFPSNLGDRPFTEGAYRKDFNERIKRLGIIKSVQPYCFRHSLATGTLNNGAGLLDVQDILGHTDPKTTRMYRRGNLGAQEQALNKYAFVANKLGPKERIHKIDQLIAGEHFEDVDGVDFNIILEVRKLLWKSLKNT